MKHITSEQRYTICVMINNNYSQKDIAIAIEKDKSVISRELKRNCDKRSGNYKSDLAQRKYEQRQRDKPKCIHFTEEVKQFVDEFINKDLSPEQIIG